MIDEPNPDDVVIVGKVRNGGIEEVVCAAYTGPAGVRRRGDMVEVAFVSEAMPRSSPVGQPVTVGDRSGKILSFERNRINRQMVAMNVRLDPA